MYAQIAKNRRVSALIVVACIALAVAGGWLIGEFAARGGGLAGAVIAALLAAGWSAVAYFGGDHVLMAAFGAVPVSRADDARLHNVVEEMCIAAGVPVPRIYRIRSPAPNAFAAGRSPRHASIAVTTGLLERLDRAELQGVIAHEMSHVKNRDILYGTLVAVLVGLVVLMADVTRRSFRFGGRGLRVRGGKGGPWMLVVAVLLIAFAILAPLVAQVLRFAASREREYLADASGALLTRYPEGLASALEKIADAEDPALAAGAAQHLFIVNPLRPRRARAGVFDTHPPLRERVRRLRAMGGGTGAA